MSEDEPLQTLGVAEFVSRARAGLHASPSDSIFDPRTGRSWGRSDFDLNPDLLEDLALMDPPRPAAVLVPVVVRETLTVLLTQRTAHLSTHAGQISFPGGRVDAEDETPVHAALREAEEEIGLERRFVEPLGFLDSYRTGTGYRIMPVVALVAADHTLALNADEVDAAFEVPLAFLMNPANHQRHEREWRGRQRAFYAMPFGERYIWGATAGMIVNMHERLFAT
ncbi:MAG: CoA pyrophosphatase [Hyphomicrobiaceae bacterium]|jgi:8-oxo-dGTP pyrophosphatase MutT (NUDIX family)